MALKEDGVRFVLCPERGNKIMGGTKQGVILGFYFVLNRVRVLSAQRLTYTQISGRVPLPRDLSFV